MSFSPFHGASEYACVRFFNILYHSFLFDAHFRRAWRFNLAHHLDQPEIESAHYKNKMDNPGFINEETIPLVPEEDYDDYKTPDTSRVDKTSFTEPDATKAASTLQVRQKVKLDKLSHCTET